MSERLNGLQERGDEPTAIDRELALLLAIDPSPEFAAKVRACISAEPAAGSRAWVWAGGVVIAATIVFATALATKHQPSANGLSTSAPVARPDTVLSTKSANVVPPSAVPRRPVSTPARARHPQLQQVAQSAQPEVLIDPALAEAVRRLAAEQPALPDIPPEPSLEPVVVEPLKVLEIPDIGSVRL